MQHSQCLKLCHMINLSLILSLRFFVNTALDWFWLDWRCHNRWTFYRACFHHIHSGAITHWHLWASHMMLHGEPGSWPIHLCIVELSQKVIVERILKSHLSPIDNSFRQALWKFEIGTISGLLTNCPENVKFRVTYKKTKETLRNQYDLHTLRRVLSLITTHHISRTPAAGCALLFFPLADPSNWIWSLKKTSW